MSWFEDVTGTSNAERQAWRDNFNGGFAVGAGADFYNAGKSGGGSLGSSKSGSDGQVKGGGNAGPTPTVTTVKVTQPTNTGGGRGGGPTLVKDTSNWSPTQYAPNQAGGPVTTGNPGPGQQVGTGPATGGGWGGGPVKLKPKDNPEYTQIVIGGHKMKQDPGWSDGGDFEDRWGEVGGAIGGLGTMGADLWRTFNSNFAPSSGYVPRGGNAWETTVGPAFYDAAGWAVDLWNDNNAVMSSARLDATGNVVRTGGGF